MGQIQQALSRLMTASVVATAGVKKAEETLNKNSEESPNNKADTGENKELSMEDVYGQLMTTGATATDISKGFTQYRKKQKQKFRERLNSLSTKEEGDQ